MKQMSEEVLLLMERLQRLHNSYENGEFENFHKRYQFEIYYWYQFKRLAELINQQIVLIRQFHNTEN